MKKYIGAETIEMFKMFSNVQMQHKCVHVCTRVPTAHIYIIQLYLHRT
jgi:hypothetical protein